MTGFGSATLRRRDLDIEVETRTVNHRFFNLKQSLPDGLARHEDEIEKLARARVSRGSMYLSVKIRAGGSNGPVFPDLKRIRACHRRLQEVRRELGINGEISIEDLLSVPSLWQDPSAGSQAALWPRIRPLVTRALGSLASARAREGRTIARDLRGHLANIEKKVTLIERRIPRVVAGFARRLDERIRAILAQKRLEVAKLDLAREIALHADRCDVSEEVQRLRAHVAEFRKIIASPGLIGRRMDFLTQEMVREANTIASKGNDAAVAARAVEIKAILEKIREQVENVE